MGRNWFLYYYTNSWKNEQILTTVYNEAEARPKFDLSGPSSSRARGEQYGPAGGNVHRATVQ